MCRRREHDLLRQRRNHGGSGGRDRGDVWPRGHPGQAPPAQPRPGRRGRPHGRSVPFTPTYDWVVGTGGAAPARRAVVDTSLCLKCHVGSMYQHGGNRVDNMDMCYLCHNTAANDEYVRGRYLRRGSVRSLRRPVRPELRHAGDAARRPFGRWRPPHRSSSIAAAVSTPGLDNESQLANWPGTGPQEVFGSDDGSGNPVTTNHNFHSSRPILAGPLRLRGVPRGRPGGLAGSDQGHGLDGRSR